MATTGETYNIGRTVWRSGRTNDFGDELIVVAGTVDDKKAYIMAWEVKQNRPECVCWNGECAYFPRMFWIDEVPPGYIKIYNHAEDKEYLIKEDKHFKVIDDKVYVQYFPEEKTKTYQPSFINVLNVPSAKTKAIEYVIWFNENQRQLDTYQRLLSTSKQARKRRRKRASISAEKQINTIQ
tara:strand:+ start:2502 stop:3044 length:543 start_codon:yes stop_codon:yes gene_type:complete